MEDRIVGTGVRKRTPAKARPLDVQRRADFGVSTDDFTGFQTGLPVVAVVGGVYGDDCSLSCQVGQFGRRYCRHRHQAMSAFDPFLPFERCRSTPALRWERTSGRFEANFGTNNNWRLVLAEQESIANVPFFGNRGVFITAEATLASPVLEQT